jgi:hypothetical protein
MDERKIILEKYVNYDPNLDHNGSQGHGIIDRVLSVFGSYESFKKYKKQNFVPTYSTGMNAEEAREESLSRIRKRLDDFVN